jgi:hypothetical protein
MFGVPMEPQEHLASKRALNKTFLENKLGSGVFNAKMLNYKFDPLWPSRFGVALMSHEKLPKNKNFSNLILGKSTLRQKSESQNF